MKSASLRTDLRPSTFFISVALVGIAILQTVRLLAAIQHSYSPSEFIEVALQGARFDASIVALLVAPQHNIILAAAGFNMSKLIAALFVSNFFSSFLGSYLV